MYILGLTLLHWLSKYRLFTKTLKPTCWAMYRRIPWCPCELCSWKLHSQIGTNKANMEGNFKQKPLEFSLDPNLIFEVLFLLTKAYLVWNTFSLWKRNPYCKFPLLTGRRTSPSRYHCWLKDVAQTVLWSSSSHHRLLYTSVRSHATKTPHRFTSISACVQWLTQRSREFKYQTNCSEPPLRDWQRSSCS